MARADINLCKMKKISYIQKAMNKKAATIKKTGKELFKEGKMLSFKALTRSKKKKKMA